VYLHIAYKISATQTSAKGYITPSIITLKQGDKKTVCIQTYTGGDDAGTAETVPTLMPIGDDHEH
jgi:hypothetical protein